MRTPLIILTLALIGGCVNDAETADPLADASTGGADAATPVCSEAQALTIGQCVDALTAEPCRNFESGSREFVPLAEEQAVPQIVGFQGSPMFVMAVRVDDLAVAANGPAPLVQLEVSLGADFVGGYTSRPEFIDDADSPTHKIAPQLYVVTLLGDETIGEEAQVRATVTSASAEQWCGEATFLVGGVVDEGQAGH